jgi:hypothetical protein
MPKGRSPPREKSPSKKRVGHRFAEINSFVDFTMARLTKTAIAVWLNLWRDTRPDGIARTGQVDMARRAGVTERAVRNALDELAAQGSVKVIRRGRIGTGPSAYQVKALTPKEAG